MIPLSPLPQTFFTENRKALAKQIETDSLVFIRSADRMVRNADLHFPWRQDSNFFYFTGIESPECSLLLIPQDKDNFDEILFIPPVDPEREKWSGKMLTKEKAREISGVQKVQANSSLLSTLFTNQRWRERLYCEVNEIFPDQPLTSQHLFLQEISKRLPCMSFKKLGPLAASLRVKKKPEEIELLKKSLAIIEEALRALMSKLRPGMTEFQAEAELSYTYLYNGCRRLGFDIIAAGGKNAAVLHYTDNKDRLKNGDLLLVDTGVEYGMYSGDITRVFPVNGKFSPRQREVYQAVLDVNRTFIKKLKPGLSWKELHEMAGKITGEIYAERGFIKEPEKHAEVSLHRIGHYLGLDVHDVGAPDFPMEAGTIITVEPGLYLPEENIGVRVEDNILFTEQGAEVLSQNIPKEVEEIEEIMSNGDQKQSNTPHPREARLVNR